MANDERAAANGAPPAAAPAAGPPSGPLIGELNAKTLAVVFLVALMVLLLVLAPWAAEMSDSSQVDSTGRLAEALFEGQGVGFLLLSIVMGVAIVGGLFLAREDSEDDFESLADMAPGSEGKAAAEPPEENWDGGGQP